MSNEIGCVSGYLVSFAKVFLELDVAEMVVRLAEQEGAPDEAVPSAAL